MPRSKPPRHKRMLETLAEREARREAFERRRFERRMLPMIWIALAPIPFALFGIANAAHPHIAICAPRLIARTVGGGLLVVGAGLIILLVKTMIAVIRSGTPGEKGELPIYAIEIGLGVMAYILLGSNFLRKLCLV